MIHRVKLLVSFVNAGGQPGIVQAALRARADALAQHPDADADVVEQAKQQADDAATPMREVARFERVIELPFPFYSGCNLKNVGPFLFEPRNVEYDMETGLFIGVEVMQLCHVTGDCPCLGHVKKYMADDRWSMIADIYADDPSKESPKGESGDG